MRIFVCAFVLALAAFGCGGTDGSSGDVSTQVFGTWNCTATGRPNWTFTVIKLGDNTTMHGWLDVTAGGAQKVAYVHLDELYLENDAVEPFRNFLYVTDASQSQLTALDQFPDMDGAGVPSYHGVK